MIKRLRYKFVAIIMALLCIIFIGIFVTLNLFMQNRSSAQTNELLQMIVEQDGVEFLQEIRRAPRFNPEFDISQDIDVNHQDISPAAKVSSFFYVKLDENSNMIELHSDMPYIISEDAAMSYVETVLQENKSKGVIDNFQFLIGEKSYGKIIVFAEKSIETQLLNQLISTSLLVAAISFIVLFLLSLFLSKWAIAPVKTAFEKQRQFISDASHELKTPLTIISTNVDVLENEIGENKRLTSIKGQTYRMNLLIKDLLSLARTDEGIIDTTMCEFNISQTILNTTLEFESRSFEEGKILDIDVEKGLMYSGDENRLKQLTTILIDNAIKHSDDHGNIKVTLKRESSKIHLSVYNTGLGIAKSEQDKIFERFYRSDSSRSRETGGYGLGLAIAKSIVDDHKGKITVNSEEGEWTEFLVIL